METLASLGFKVDSQQVRKATDDLSGLTQAGAQAESAAGKITSAFKQFSGVLKALGVAVSVTALAALVRAQINAADEMSKLSQKTGVAVKDLAGLQLAFQQAGVGAGGLQQAMARLSVQIANGSPALDAIGVSARDAAGEMRPMRDVLGDVADRFASYQDGAAKTALAVQIFGRAGADLIPLLNAGSEGLARYDDLARRLGLTMSQETAQAAEQFNDTLDTMNMAVQGVFRQVAAQMLPAFNAVAGQILETATNGQFLTNVSNALAAALKSLYTVGVGVAAAFKAVGTAIGATFAVATNNLATVAQALGQAARGQFGEAWATIQGGASRSAFIVREAASDITRGFQDAAASVRAVWSEESSELVDGMNAISRASRQAAPSVAELGAAASQAGAATAEAVSEFEKLAGSLMSRIAEGYAEAQSALHGYNRAQTEFLKLTGSEVWATLTNDQRAFVASQFEMLIAQEQNAAAAQLNAQAQQQALQVLERGAQTAQDRVKAMEQENKALTLARTQNVSLARAVELVAVARLREQRAMQGNDGAAVALIDQEIAARERLIELMEGRELQQAADNLRQREAQEWDRTWQQVGQSFTDALMQGGQSVKQYLVNLFRTMVLRPMLAPIGGAFGGMFGGSAMAGQAASGGGVGILGQIGSLAGAFGTGLASSFSSIMAAGVGGWASAAGSLIGSGALSGIAAGVGMIAAPLALAAAAWKPLFGRTLKDSGIQGTFGADGFQGEQFQFFKGGLFRSDKTTTSALDGGLQAALGQQFQAMQTQAAAMAQTLGQSADGIREFTTSVKLSFRGLNEQQQQQALADEMGRIGNAMADLVPGLADFAQMGESSSETLARLANSLTTVNGAFDTLGWSLLGGMTGADFASNLIAAAGGVDALNNSVSFYFQNFYSESERLATLTRQTTQALAALGFEMPTTREGFRAMVEAAQAIGNPSLVSSLLSIAPAVSSVIAATQQLAPAVAAVTQAAPPAVVRPIVQSFQSVSRGMDTMSNSLQRLGDSVANEVRRLRGLMETSSTDSMAALQARFAITTASARAGNQEALAALPTLSRSLEDAAQATATTAADVARMRAFLANSLSATLGSLRLNVPQFAVGTNMVPRDMLAMVHKGEAIVPKAYNPAAGGGDMGEVLEQLKMMRSETQATAKNTNRMARILERVTPDGDAVQTRESA